MGKTDTKNHTDIPPLFHAHCPCCLQLHFASNFHGAPQLVEQTAGPVLLGHWNHQRNWYAYGNQLPRPSVHTVVLLLAYAGHRVWEVCLSYRLLRNVLWCDRINRFDRFMSHQVTSWKWSWRALVTTRRAAASLAASPSAAACLRTSGGFQSGSNGCAHKTSQNTPVTMRSYRFSWYVRICS